MCTTRCDDLHQYSLTSRLKEQTIKAEKQQNDFDPIKQQPKPQTAPPNSNSNNVMTKGHTVDCEGVGVLALADLGVLDTLFTAAPSPGLKSVGEVGGITMCYTVLCKVQRAPRVNGMC